VETGSFFGLLAAGEEEEEEEEEEEGGGGGGEEEEEEGADMRAKMEVRVWSMSGDAEEGWR